jgi:hypothetical protein
MVMIGYGRIPKAGRTTLFHGAAGDDGDAAPIVHGTPKSR